MGGRTIGALLVAATTLLLGPGAVVAHPGGVTLSGRGTATIDGVVSADEWAGAGSLPFLANVPGGGTVPATLRVMNDATNLYFSLTIARLGDDHAVAAFFDNDHDGLTPEEGDDGFSFGPFAPPFVSGFFDNVRSSRPPCPAGSMCGLRDPELGGTNDGAAARGVHGGETHFELSHPLNSADDANDFSLAFGDTVGFGFQYAILNAGGDVFTRPALNSDLVVLAPDAPSPPPPGSGGGGSGAADAVVALAAETTTPTPNQSVELRATVTNKEPVTGATGLRLVITLPAGVTLLGPPAFDRGSGCVGTTTLDCFLDYVPGNGSTLVRFSVNVGAAGSKEISAVATMNVSDADETNNRAALMLAVAERMSVPPPPRAPSGVTRTGTARADVLRGTAGPDVLNGHGGNDRIFGLAGHDRLVGGAGADTLEGGGGRDVLDAGAGADIVRARDGAIDNVRCGAGRDRVTADRVDRIGADCEVVSRR